LDVLFELRELAELVTVVTGAFDDRWHVFHSFKPRWHLLDLHRTLDDYVVVVRMATLSEDHFAGFIPLLLLQYTDFNQLLPHLGWVLHEESQLSKVLGVAVERRLELFVFEATDNLLLKRFLLCLLVVNE